MENDAPHHQQTSKAVFRGEIKTSGIFLLRKKKCVENDVKTQWKRNGNAGGCQAKHFSSEKIKIVSIFMRENKMS